MENKTLTKYIATITVGDEYHKRGEEIELSSWNIDKTKENGLSLEIGENSYGDTRYHLYPCTIRKETYHLELISTENVDGGDRMNAYTRRGEVGFDYLEREYDWKDHWC